MLCLRMLHRNISGGPAYSRAGTPGPFRALPPTRIRPVLGATLGSAQMAGYRSVLIEEMAVASVRSPNSARDSDRNLRADLDHASGRDLEEVGGVAGRFRQADEQ